MSNYIDSKEFAAAEQEATESGAAVTVQLSRPVTYEGKTFQKVALDFERLTGNDALAIEGEMQAMGKPVIIPSLSGEYLVRMAARACVDSVGVDFFAALPIRDYHTIRSKARNFLHRSES